MQELTPQERKVQIIAAIFGLTVAAIFAVYIGTLEGVGVGIAAFALSWTFVALFVLVVRTVHRRAAAGREPAAAEAVSTPSQSRSAERRRRRRKKR